MIQYLIDKGYSYEKAEALFNSFKNSNAKPYSGNNYSKGGRGRRRRGYRRYGRGGGGSGSAKKTVVKKSVPIKQKDFAASKASYKDVASALQPKSRKTRSKTKVPTVSSSRAKVQPPKVKLKKYEI